MAMIGTYRHNQTAVGGNGTTTTFVSEKVPRNQIVEISFASVIDYTTKNKKMNIGIRDVQLTDVYLKTIQESSTFGIFVESPFLLFEGEAVVGVVEATTTADALHLSVHGKRYALKEG